MLTQQEINKLLKKDKPVMADERISKDAESWDLSRWDITPRLIGTVYSYLKTKYQFGESLEELERNMGIALDSISKALRELEDNGFVAISRHTKPFKYAVIK